MKEDAPVPETIPKKRRQLEQAPDYWIASWLSRPELTPSEKKKLDAIRESRRREEPTLALLVQAREGTTPEQSRRITEIVERFDNCLVFNSGNRKEYRDMVKKVGYVIAAPKEMKRPLHPPEDSVWAVERYAHHRGIPTIVVLSNGTEE